MSAPTCLDCGADLRSFEPHGPFCPQNPFRRESATSDPAIVKSSEGSQETGSATPSSSSLDTSPSSRMTKGTDA